jgi:putative membrane protein insertion efficiency factor
MNYKHYFLFLILWLLAVVSFAQSKSKAEQLSELFKPNKKENYKKYLKQSSNEIEATGALLFLGYKSFFSSQDMASCVFTPTCSVYAIESFQNKNPFVAYVMVFDRLSRCHPLTKKNEYPYYKNTTQLYDPIP